MPRIARSRSRSPPPPSVGLFAPRVRRSRHGRTDETGEERSLARPLSRVSPPPRFYSTCTRTGITGGGSGFSFVWGQHGERGQQRREKTSRRSLRRSKASDFRSKLRLSLTPTRIENRARSSWPRSAERPSPSVECRSVFSTPPPLHCMAVRLLAFS